MVFLAVILALFWGMIWAAFLQWNEYGRYLALRRTWVTVVIGVGVDLLIALFVTPLEVWLVVCAIVIASSLGIISRSLYNEHLDERAVEDIHAGCRE
jgi:hypothetical protein